MHYGLGLISPFEDGKARRISSPVGPRTAPKSGASTWHQGTDYAAARGTRLIAPLDGVVTVTGFEKGFGNRIGICGKDGTCVHLSHMDALSSGLVPGQTVRRGTYLGTTGNTGNSTGPHLDYIVTKHGKIVSPDGKIYDRVASQSYLRGIVRGGKGGKVYDATTPTQNLVSTPSAVPMMPDTDYLNTASYTAPKPATVDMPQDMQPETPFYTQLEQDAVDAYTLMQQTSPYTSYL